MGIPLRIHLSFVRFFAVLYSPLDRGERLMTVCIAAICEGGKNIVVAADRMFTFTAPVSLEFETGERKIDILAPTCVALGSGNSSFGKEIVSATLGTLAGSTTPQIDAVVEALKTAYIQIRANKVREMVVVPMLGPDYLRYEQFNVSLPTYLEKQAGMFQQIVIQANQVNLGTDFLVAGIDNKGARVAYVGHPGTVAWLDKLGYGAVGSGAIHATTRLALVAQSSTNSLTETLYYVYAAKRASEVAPGVGQITDISVIHHNQIKECLN